MSQPILTTFANGVCTITLHRPDVLNSINNLLSAALKQALEDANARTDVRCILLTGSGRAFCTGQDLQEVVPQEGVTTRLGTIVRENYNPVVSLIRNIEKPVVCALNGVAAGAGANLALACDIVIASESASLIQSFSNVGLIPDSGGTFMLPRMVGLARATWMTFLGEKLGATEAHQMGLIYKVVAAENLMSDAMALANRLAAMPTKGLGLTKRAFNRSFHHSLSDQLSLEEALQDEAGLTDDYGEGVRAFLEKRKPNFQGH